MKVIHAGILCPFRPTPKGIEILLTKRSFWNYQKNRPMKFPGEYVFPGGKFEPMDITRLFTSIRESREETGYEGIISNLEYLRSCKERINGHLYDGKFYVARFDNDSNLNPKEGEVDWVGWVNPHKALQWICSDEFTRLQNLKIKRLGLDNPIHGNNIVIKRQFPREVAISIHRIIQLEPYII